MLGAVLAALPNMIGGSAQVTTTTTHIPVVTTSVVSEPGGAPELVYKVYGDPRLGFRVAKTVVENRGSAPLYDVEVSYRLEGHVSATEHHSGQPRL